MSNRILSIGSGAKRRRVAALWCWGPAVWKLAESVPPDATVYGIGLPGSHPRWRLAEDEAERDSSAPDGLPSLSPPQNMFLLSGDSPPDFVGWHREIDVLFFDRIPEDLPVRLQPEFLDPICAPRRDYRRPPQPQRRSLGTHGGGSADSGGPRRRVANSRVDVVDRDAAGQQRFN